ncbi:MAG: tRNA (guanosine(37)-N1)-methyltransferase TrmD [Gammaproteobacteria bacterium]|nr:MAG: tRNA (guanosine(37)-N1)-methyltransferase TrmD [Gammaproteobacteria bacterium]
MRFDVITLFPEFVRTITTLGVTGRAFTRGIARLFTWNPRDYTEDRHRTVDDRPYGGGPGMVMRYAPLAETLAAVRREAPGAPLIHLTPQGRRLDQRRVRELAALDGIILLAGRYEGIDERFIARHVDEELSIGDYVLSGGELPALVVIDAVTRLLPGALGDAASAEQDSFSEGLLDCPHYTRPECIDGDCVPEVLRSGDHAAIARWRRRQRLGRTWLRRPDLLEAAELSEEDRRLLAEFLAEQGIERDPRDH